MSNKIEAVEVSEVAAPVEYSKIPVRAKGRALGVALLDVLHPYMATPEERVVVSADELEPGEVFKLSSRTMRGYFRECLSDEIGTSSVATIYNFAKQDGVEKGKWADFSKSAGEAIGPKQIVPDELEIEIIDAMAKAIAQAHVVAQEEAAAKAKALAEAKAAKAQEAEEKRLARIKAAEERQAKTKAARELTAKQREENRLQREQERQEMKAKKEADKKAKVEAAVAAVAENPENKWQIENKTDGTVISYHPTRKDASDAKKNADDIENLKIVKIPA